MELHQERVEWALGRSSSSEGNGHGTCCPWQQSKAFGDQGEFGQCSQMQGLNFGQSAWSQELDSTILLGASQLRIFCDSVVQRNNRAVILRYIDQRLQASTSHSANSFPLLKSLKQLVPEEL